MNTSILGNAAHNQLNPDADLNEKLKAFQQPPIHVNVRPNPVMVNPNVAATEVVTDETQEQGDTSQEPITEGEQPPSETTEREEGELEEETSVSPEFAAAFETYFGMKPDEAIQTVNQLTAFRDEMTLMRQWGVNPGEYDQRMSAVKQFYQTLPEDGREQFNTIEGANVIWEHLQKTGAASTTTKRTSANTKTASRTKAASTPKQSFLKKSEILQMDTATYNKNLPAITKAFAEGRVILDA